jgi:hypothetical protein
MWRYNSRKAGIGGGSFDAESVFAFDDPLRACWKLM